MSSEHLGRARPAASEANPDDLLAWNRIFAQVPGEWRTAPPSLAMQACAGCFAREGVRTVLDLGCGIGRWTIWLRRKGFETAGADFAPNAVDYARAWAADEGLEIPFACVPVAASPFPDRRFDAVVCALVLDLVATPELDAAVERIGEALRPGGLLFAVFNPLHCPVPAAENPTAGITQVHYIDAELTRRFSAAGFSLVEQLALDLGTRGFLWRLTRERPVETATNEPKTDGPHA